MKLTSLMAQPKQSNPVIFEAETPNGTLAIEDVEGGLLFVATSNELTAQKKFITESVRWFHGQLKQWLLKKESRSNFFQLAFREPQQLEGMIAAPKVPPPLMLSYDETVEMEKAIREWIARLKR
jgi:hypothetical protein